MATARDGKKVPISLVYKKSLFHSVKIHYYYMGMDLMVAL